ncbi:tRNA A64-2'-O-ribosylphosphate transferase [Fennellomyces sp. T-0311]|nr:tRNA A64-2'-O-ribosylphosphate transferase [Fennellomyces sp. T-0311]
MPSDGLFENEYHAGANQIRKDHKNLLNRLRSIKEDADFVKEIASFFPSLALVANERCGSWYIDPTDKQVHSAYFKSTDGHMSQWDFNLRRSNLHLLDIIKQHKGCIIVDSTRRGKRIPDALSKTIPIWCCAINRAVIQHKPGSFENEEEVRAFCSLPSAVSRSEHAQIEARMDEFAQRLLNSGGIDMERISKLLDKPLRPLWFTPQSSFFEAPDYAEASFWPVICLSASQAVESGCQARPGYLYVQGSGDDQEAWCHGLTPRLFWQNQEALLNATSALDCEERVHEIVAKKQEDTDVDDYNMIQGTTMAVGSTKAWKMFDVVINCTESSPADHPQCLQLPILEGKKGQYKLFQSIPTAIAFVREPLMQNKRILIYGAKGRDRAVGIALAIYVKYYDQQGNFCPDGAGKVDKKSIHEHLLRIISSRPKAAPSRVTLKKVNSYFMS